MATTLNFKNLIDLPEWRPLAVAPTANSATVPSGLAFDLRNDTSQDPYIYKLTSATTFEKYNAYNDEWISPLAATLTSGGVAAGAGIIFVP
ncbi:MAG: hypothetical protein NTV62_02580, partial [Candidatus Gribaldobacteria bacterium]|nr:hypothetical protein [Candidatus Gribaldobacteria bacterium]